jgi:hypothetical protein
MHPAEPNIPVQPTPTAHASRTICGDLYALIQNHPGEEIKVSSLVKALHEKGFGLLMMILVLPNCIPIPIPPGGSTVFSIPLLFLTIQMVFGRRSPWLPEWLKEKHISQSFMLKLLGIISPRLTKLESIMKPRMAFAESKLGEKLTGMFWLLFSISIAVPLPMTNFIPGIGILISSLGLIGRDGYVMLLGFLVGTVGTLLTGLILLLGSDAILSLFL